MATKKSQSNNNFEWFVKIFVNRIGTFDNNTIVRNQLIQDVFSKISYHIMHLLNLS